MKYYLYINGQQLGPFEENQLIAQGMQPDTQVWCETMPQWLQANQVPELARYFQRQAQPQQQAYQQQAYQQQAYQQQQQAYYQQPAVAAESNDVGITGFVMSLFALLFMWMPYVNLPMTLTALVLSICGAGRKTKKALAITGIILAGIALVAIILSLFVPAIARFLYVTLFSALYQPKVY
ncbi:MAG: DUF4339 domain-containing protein [Muribaculaceae bacterium]|nr:DUF4339 domain-containing protein [Muribaculaceae bacterium]